MSNLRLNSNLTQKQAFTHILYHLLDVHDNNQHAIRGWGQKLLGYGLKQTEFDLFKNSTYFVTTRIFRYNVDELLEKQLIRVFDKSTKTKKGPFYSITPLGLFYLLQHVEKFSNNKITQIFKLLEFSSSNNKNFKQTFLKSFNEKQIFKAMKNLFYYAKLNFVSNGITLYLDVPLISLSSVRFLQVTVNSKNITLDNAMLLTSDVPKLPAIITSDELDFQISFTLKNLLCYYLFKQIKNKKEFLNTSKYFQQMINSVTYIIGSSLEDDLEEITKVRIRAFGTADMAEVLKLIDN
jgi:hypothetical protein